MVPAVHGFFYRVTGVTTPGAAGVNSMELELQTDWKLALTQGVVVVMENVAEVFQRKAIGN
jgi:hypothetical protein